MKNTLHLFKKDVDRKWKNPWVILGFLLLPVFFTLIFALAFGGSDAEILPQLDLLTTDLDQSLVSSFFLSALSQGELKEMVRLKEVEEQEGRRLLDQGKASAMLIIPENFGDKAWESQNVEITLLKNPSEQFLPQIAEEIIDTASLLFSALFSVFSDEVDLIQQLADKDDFSNDNISSLSIRFKDKFESMSKYVFPPVISLKQVTVSQGEEEEDQMSVAGYVLPGIAIMFLLFICNVVFEDVLKEKESGTLLRMNVSPLRLSEYVWSKILVSVAIGVICTVLLVVFGAIIFSIHWGNIVVLMLTIFSLNLLVAGFISIFYSFIKTERQAGAVLSSVIIVMSLLGGSMVSVTQFPPLFQKISKITVNYWGIELFHRNMRGLPPSEILPIILVLTIVGFCFSLTGTALLNKNLKKGLIK